MEDALEFLYSRRSIRRYTDEPVPEELIIRILEAGRWAPTAHFRQPLKIIVLRDENKDKIAKMLTRRAVYTGARRDAATFGETLNTRVDAERQERARAALARFFRTGDEHIMGFKAPVVIVVTGNVKFAAWEDGPACIENMLLEAHSLGLGCCWYPVGGERTYMEWRKILKIPKDYVVINWFSIGWPAESPRARPRLPLETMVGWEDFTNTRKLPEIVKTGKYERPGTIKGGEK